MHAGAREYQEDRYYVERLEDAESSCLVIVADGMGGEVGGAEASRIAVEGFAEQFHAKWGEGDRARDALASALFAANDALAEAVRDDPDLDGFGCTLLALIVRPSQGAAWWVSVGDSPLWLVRDGRLNRLNDDHSMAPVLAGLAEMGRITEEEAAQDPKRNQLRSALSGDEVAKVDLPEEPLALASGDVLVAASDGLDTLPGDEIMTIVGQASPEEAADRLVQGVLERASDGQDNVTAVAIRYLGNGAGAGGRSAGGGRRSRALRYSVLAAGLAAAAVGTVGLAGWPRLLGVNGTVVVAGGERARLYVDGEARGRLGQDTAIELEPGERRLRFERDGYQTVVKLVRVKSGHRRRIEIEMQSTARRPSLPPGG